MAQSGQLRQRVTETQLIGLLDQVDQSSADNEPKITVRAFSVRCSYDIDWRSRRLHAKNRQSRTTTTSSTCKDAASGRRAARQQNVATRLCAESVGVGSSCSRRQSLAGKRAPVTPRQSAGGGATNRRKLQSTIMVCGIRHGYSRAQGDHAPDSSRRASSSSCSSERLCVSCLLRLLGGGAGASSSSLSSTSSSS